MQAAETLVDSVLKLRVPKQDNLTVTIMKLTERFTIPDLPRPGRFFVGMITGLLLAVLLLATGLYVHSLSKPMPATSEIAPQAQPAVHSTAMLNSPQTSGGATPAVASHTSAVYSGNPISNDPYALPLTPSAPAPSGTQVKKAGKRKAAVKS